MSDIELPEEMFESFSPEEQNILESGGEILLVLDSGNCAQCRYGNIWKFFRLRQLQNGKARKAETRNQMPTILLEIASNVFCPSTCLGLE